jgi:hypothetical protein
VFIDIIVNVEDARHNCGRNGLCRGNTVYSGESSRGKCRGDCRSWLFVISTLVLSDLFVTLTVVVIVVKSNEVLVTEVL